VLVDHAKSRAREKRNGGAAELAIEDADRTLPSTEFDVVALDDALECLLQLEPRMAQIIELHYFGGMTYDEIAAFVGTSAATVHRELRLARAWLLQEIKK
jgi:RNA polymerase sigma factor (TIGR02999 family)